MVMMSPQIATTKPAPAASRTSRTGTGWWVGAPSLVAGRDYVGQLVGSDLFVVEGGAVIATVPLPLEEQNRVRNEGCGAAVVRVEEGVRPISGVADVNIR